jgi:hypothetical protein
MSATLWSANTLKNFWKTHPEIDDETWWHAIQQCLPALQLQRTPVDGEDLLAQTLGEGQFGEGHWELGRVRRLYYDLKPFIPRMLSRALRRILQSRHKHDFELGWPIEERYPRFQFQALETALELTGRSSVRFEPFWPHQKKFAFVLTHDIEEGKGQQFVLAVADLEESLGFRSSFNFVPERYKVNQALMDKLRVRGFEVGVHGLKHDGKLFNSHTEFMQRAERINRYLEEYHALGFRSPLTLRNPQWMQAFNIEYDLSFFDTDPFEPMPGGVMSIHPFFIGHFVELPYTLVQDHTLTTVLGETTPKLWLEKIDMIEKYNGMALVNSHPDYLRDPSNLMIYKNFLHSMRTRGGYWHALPHDVATWWRRRADLSPRGVKDETDTAIAKLENGCLAIEVSYGDHSYAPMS